MPSGEPVSQPVVAQPAPARYVGSGECRFCHSNQHQDWLHSDHHQAMMEADTKSILGKFDNATLNHHGQTTQFMSKDGHNTVSTDQKSIQPADLTIQYTFGIYPLQQYLVPLGNGSWHSLPFAWDSRKADAGGQRWFHLHATENITPGDALHWRSLSHNANHMCIECHTTDYRKAFLQENNSYQSAWLETGVGCESCHGPGSRHLEWARSPDKQAIPDKGWDIQLTSGNHGLWIPQSNQHPPLRKEAGSTSEIERCAQCHSRRARIAPDNQQGKLLDAFLPSLLDEGLYYADGQILDEVFEYGSFLQSRMSQQGVTCSNCHNPHNGKPKAEGNALCLQCHAPDYDTPKHTFHAANTPGSACIDCHMPFRTYMEVDARRDHSFRVPRPDLSVSLGTPNACNQCHTDQTAAWAANAIDQQRGHSQWRKPHYGQTLAKARNAVPSAFAELVKLIRDTSQPGIVRATAVTLLPGFVTRDYPAILRDMAGDPEPLVRLAVTRASDALPAEQLGFLLPLLEDSLLAIRIETARLLAGTAWSRNHSGFALARQQYIDAQQLHLDTAAAHTNLAGLAMREGRLQEAEIHLRQALQREPYFIPAAVNLADFFRANGRDTEGEAVLLASLSHTPENAELNLAYALWLVRQGRMPDALKRLELAYQSDPNPRYAFVYALALQQNQEPQEALRVLEKAVAQPTYSRDVQQLRLALARQLGNADLARKFIQDWQGLDPQDPELSPQRP